jgi:protein N-terminal amidase
MEVLEYWLERMKPLIKAETEQEIICVFANRTGIEGNTPFTGTSAVVGIQGGKVKLYGVLGRGEKKLLIVDTNKRPKGNLVLEPISTAPEAKSDRSLDDDNTPDLSTKTEATTVCISLGSEKPKTRLSLVDPESLKPYFAKGHAPEARMDLHQVLPTQQPISPFTRPASPKSQRRSRQLEQDELSLVSPETSVGLDGQL